MIQLIIILIGLIILLGIATRFSNRFILSPQVVFPACFIPAVAYGFLFVNSWDFNFSSKTIFTILGGCTLFVLISYITKYTFNYFKSRSQSNLNTNNNTNIDVTSIDVKSWFLVCFLFFQIAILLWTILFLFDATQKNNLSEALAYYDYSNKFTDNPIEFPSLLHKARIFSMASCYVWIYILLYNHIHGKKTNSLLLLLNILLGMVNTISTGARGDLIQICLAIVVQFYFIYGQKNGYKIKLTAKKIIIILIICIIAVLLFLPFGKLLGREINKNMIDYIGMYLSAPLKNLDTFIEKNDFGCEINEQQTLIHLINFIGRNFGMPELCHKLDVPFNSVNGINIGNVATTFYAYLYDGGWMSVVLFITVMAIICELIFSIASTQKNLQNIKISILVYSFVFFTIIFSFFSNKFYEEIFQHEFVYLIISWYILKFIIEKLHFKKL